MPNKTLKPLLILTFLIGILPGLALSAEPGSSKAPSAEPRPEQVLERQGTVHQSHAGIVTNNPQEAVYYVGSDGLPLNGEKRYRIHVPQGSEPPVHAFWPISMYDKKGNMAPNSLNRYAVGDRTPGLVHDENSGLTIALQHDQPEDPGVN